MTHSLTSSELDRLVESMTKHADQAAAAGSWATCHTWQAAVALIEAERHKSFARRIRRRERNPIPA